MMILFMWKHYKEQILVAVASLLLYAVLKNGNQQTEPSKPPIGFDTKKG